MISSAEVESSQRWSAAREGILLVEDDRAIRDALEAILADEGYRVSTAEDGQQALDRLHSGQGADLIVLDLRMPVMNGWRFRALQKADPLLFDIPVLAISADGSAQAEAIDAAGYLRKPLSADGVCDEVSRILVEAARGRLCAELEEAERVAALARVGEEIQHPLAAAMEKVDLAVGRVMGVVHGVAGSAEELTTVPSTLTECRLALNRIRDIVEQLATTCQCTGCASGGFHVPSKSSRRGR
jgi:CheY-like chemotaxis protein